jgi:hypothetical protein
MLYIQRARRELIQSNQLAFTYSPRPLRAGQVAAASAGCLAGIASSAKNHESQKYDNTSDNFCDKNYFRELMAHVMRGFILCKNRTLNSRISLRLFCSRFNLLRKILNFTHLRCDHTRMRCAVLILTSPVRCSYSAPHPAVPLHARGVEVEQ